MAKFHSYYVLCPLIDQKSFLGVSKDKSKENVIVTLSRNVVNRYQLSDQKQTCGWTSKEHITSGVVYDNELDCYVGVFNNNTIKTWSEDTENLEKVKKNKFSQNILRIVQKEDQTSLLVFTNGNCTSLSYGIENRKTLKGKTILKSNDEIVAIETYKHSNTEYICYIVKNDKDEYEILNCSLREELGDLEKSKLSRTKVQRTDDSELYVVGKFINSRDENAVYILWSDSKLIVYDLIEKKWKTIGTVKGISTTAKVSLAWMGDKHLLFFGSNEDADGAIIVAYNTSIGVGSCNYPMKMYTEDAKLYCFDGKIILESSNHIGLLPYIVEASRSLSSLLGSREFTEEEKTLFVDWGVGKISYKGTLCCKPLDLPLITLTTLGVTEGYITETLLKYFMPKLFNFGNIVKVLQSYKDIPESYVCEMLSELLLMYGPQKKKQGDEDDTEEINKDQEPQQDIVYIEDIKEIYRKKSSRNYSKLEILKVLMSNVTFCDAVLVTQLRSHLTLEHTMVLLQYICFVLTNKNIDLKGDEEAKFIDWCIIVLDAFYQQFVLSKEDRVTVVLEEMTMVVNDLIDNIMILDSTLPQLDQILRYNGPKKCSSAGPYCIELMEI